MFEHAASTYMITSPNEYECQSAQHTCCVDWQRDSFVFDNATWMSHLKDNVSIFTDETY